MLGGLAAGKLTPNFASSNAGTVAGTVVLVFAAATGVMAMRGAWQARTR